MIVTVARKVAPLLVLLLSACQESQDLPTLAPTVVPLSQLPTLAVTTAPVSSASTAPTTDLATPAQSPMPSSTPVIHTPPPTPFAGPGVNITSPAAGSEIVLGQEVVVSGLVHMGSGQDFSLALVSKTGHVLGQARPAVSDLNSWQVTLSIPNSVSGQAEFQAQLIDKDDQVVASDTLPVLLRVDPQAGDQYLILNRPVQTSKAVAGFNLFFDGIANEPVDNVVTISLWNEGCQKRVAKQGFRLRGSGYWQGFVVVPVDVTGPVCAVAHFGEGGSDSWREAQVMIDVLASDDERALDVLIGNPPPDKQLTPGTSLLLYGTAYNAPGREVLVSILLDNSRLLTEGVTAADMWGYWELELFIPANAAGAAHIEASIGERGSEQFAQSIVPVYIGQR